MDEKQKTPGSSHGDTTLSSKGVDAYGYNSKSNANIPVLMPSADYAWDGCSQDTKSAIDPWGTQPYIIQHANVQINSSDICYEAPDNSGKFVMIAGVQPAALDFGFAANIYPYSGELDSSDASDMLHTPAVIHEGFDNISWGLYRAGPGNFGLTNQYQAYLYLTEDQSSWMGDLVNSNPAFNQRAFNAFVLPGAHDAGMFDNTWISDPNNLQAMNGVLAQAMKQEGISSDLANEILGNSTVQDNLSSFLVYFAFTQKEQVQTILNLGVRYFDFRPGYIASSIQDNLQNTDSRLYHQHDFIPSYPYDRFLADVLQWLKDHLTEIVVISLSTNGFYDHDSMDPKIDDLEQYWNGAVSITGSSVQLASADDLASTYSELIQTNKRIFFLNNLSGGAASYYPASKYDTYDNNDAYYATFDPSSIIDNVLNNISPIYQAKQDYSVVQLQGTCTAALGANIQNEWSSSEADCIEDIGELALACTDSQAASFLMSTKPSFDQDTYPWIYNNLTQKLPNEQLLVVLNDFADNALTDICKTLTTTR